MEADQVSVPGNTGQNLGDLHDFNAIAQWRGKHQADKRAFIFLADGEKETHTLTFGELHRSACSVAAWIQEHGLVGERVLLLYPPGIDFIIGFLGCLYAGAIAVPAYPPHPRRSDPRLESMFEDCQPKAAFCIHNEVENLSLQLADHNLVILATDTLSPFTGTWESPAVSHDSIAYLQYTSGSTGKPKGVMVTQGNLLHQCEYLTYLSGHDESMVLVSWQPFFHDMGLVGTVVTTIFTGAICYLMAPAAFLRKPIRWLQAISRYRGTAATGPNFSFELCVTQTTAEQREGLDLSSWKWAWNGAEPVRSDTLDRFCEVYEPFGFDRRTHFPCYGMAETTLCATADRPDRLPIISSVQREALEQNHAVPCASEDPMAVDLVSSGIWGDGMEIAIVEPETLEQRPDGYVGEIWVAGQSVAHGYWQRPQETEETFNAYIADSSRGPYLRTGDLGFVRDGELFVTGRLKDMIIIRGRNLYPQDVELVAQQSHDALQSDACAAFSIQVDGHEEIALAMEVKRTERRRDDFGDIFEAVRSAVAENHGVAIHWIGLIQPGRITKTSSGKVMRRACRRDFDSGDLALLTEWQMSDREDGEDSPGVVAPTPDPGLVQRLQSLPPALRHQTLMTHFQSEISRFLELQSLPDPQKGFERLGIDSLGAVKLVSRLQDQLGNTVDLPTTLLFDQPNIEAVARYLEQTLFGHEEKAAGIADAAPLLNEPVAIVGLACRFPDADDADEFWQVLDQGKDTIREVPEERWDIDTYFDEDAGVPGKMNSRYGGFINGIDGFDAAFFDISPREATSMDPQHRHLLEVSWLALEDAGIAPTTLNGRPVGVFVGISTGDYEQILSTRGVDGADAFSATGNAHSAAAGRLSFMLGLQGPCLAVDTACSSSLVAVHQAVQSLRLGECEAALVGGVNTVLRPDISVAFSRARLLAPDGRCKTFDATADGYVRSEGCGMVVLKRLRDAERDGDRILAVIRGSAVNQDGRSSGLTAPNGPSQTKVISNALANGGVSPADVHYLECHGTGTVLGDPIEVQAANAALSKGRDASNPVMIGSVKTNLGHLEAAAGIAGLIKIVLALKHARIPRSLHFQTPNPHIPWDSLAVKVAADAVPWIADSQPRIAGVSSFGFTGTNAHVVVEGAPQVESKETTVETESGPCLLAVSARTEEALSALAGLYADWMQTHDDLPLEDVCHTANTGRNHFEHRAVLLGTSGEGVREQLVALANGKKKAGTALGVAPREGRRRVAFLFPGEGLQYSGMASELYENEPVFRECLERCARVYDEDARETDSPPLKELMFHPEGMESSQQTRHIRAALYSLQVSLAALWRSWGVPPDALMGHSAGEYAAACVAGVFSVEEGLRLVMERARLLESLPAGGAMMSVTAPADAVDAALEGDDSVSVSAYNGLNTVISGPAEQLDALIERFEKEERYCTRLPATNAAHSLFVEPILEDFEAFAQGIEYSAPGTPLVSGLFGTVIEPGSIPDASYWRNQTRKPVRFAQGIQALFETTGCDVVLELGPQAELIWLAQMSHRPDHQVLWASSLEKGHNALEYMLSTAAKLHANGTDLDFSGIENADKRYRRLTLPTYPFQHKSYWAGPMGQMAPSQIEDLLYKIEWQPGDTPGPSSSVSAQNWLIISDDEELGTALTAALEERGKDSVTNASVNAGDTSATTIEAILEQAWSNTPVDHVVFVAGPMLDADADADAIQTAQKSGVERALFVAQSLISMKGMARLWLVTRGVYAVLDNEAVDPTHAPVWGFARTFATEHPDRYGGLLDLALEDSPSVAADALARALLCGDGECQVALRNGQRWLARLQRSPLPDSLTDDLVAEATYLITGGTGALGLALAHHLAKRGAKQIVLSSRSGGGEAVQAAIAEMADCGCRVEVLRADITVASEAEQLLVQIGAIDEGRPLRGIIHAAGLLEGAPATELTPELLEKVIAPKVWGAWNLHRLTRDSQLDLFVMFSSSAALLGLVGHSNYSAANAFLDSLAQHRQNIGLAAVAINWGPWAEDGMATRMEAASWEAIGTGLMQSRTTMQAFDYLCDGKAPQVCVQPMNWQRWSDLARSGRLPPILLKFLDPLITLQEPGSEVVRTTTQTGSNQDIGPLVQQLAALSSSERRSAVQSYITEQVGTVLGVPKEQIDRETGFFDLGMNSIMAVELRSALQADLGGSLDLQAAVIFNHPTVQRLAEYLLDVLFDKKASPGFLLNTTISSASSVEVHNIDTTRLASTIDSAAEQTLGASWVPNIEDTEDDGNRRRTLAAILALQSEVDRLRNRAADPVAVVGLSCRYPHAQNAEEFWHILDEGRDEITEVPTDRWDNRTYYDADPDAPGKMNTRRGGFITGIDKFDADFFGISPREAMSLDPQQRLVLEVAWEALESANIVPGRIRGVKGGVFVGISISDYAERVSGQGLDHLDAYGGTGNALCASAGRLSFTLGWQGPALAIDTACSSSLVSIHQACTSLRSGECDIALAGGVNTLLNPNVSLILSKAHMLSPDGSCKTFDAAANGYVRGEGCGMLVLKRLSDAERDGDKILGLIRGSAVNQDGRSSGLTVPNGLAQERVISEALVSAGVEPSAVQYLECHGTGTPLGDPIEVQAANEVLSKGREGREPLLIGSVKTNIGHTETAAGVAGVIKVILAMQHEKLPKNLHFHDPNPHIPWSQLNLRVVTESLPWPSGQARRIAGVSSFGFVGTNAHVVVEEAPITSTSIEPEENKLPERENHLFVLSARSRQALSALAQHYVDWLERYTGASLADLCYTANNGREHFERRSALVFGTKETLAEQLGALAQGEEVPDLVTGRVKLRGERRIAFLFTGQGSQQIGMGRELYHSEPVFREHFDRCADEFARLREDAPDLRDLVFEKAGEGLIDQTGYTQPALYALEVSLAALWRSWGVEPDVLLGHSVGEYAAAYTAGVFSLEEGLRLITERGRLMQNLPSGGGMASLSVSADKVAEALHGQDDVRIAAYNGADTVISGPLVGIDALIEQFESQGMRCKRLVTSHAFHSKLMDPILNEFMEFAGGVSYQGPSKRLISNVNGEVVAQGRILDAEYWTDHIRQSVQFSRGISTLQDLGCDTMLEIGPHPVLTTMAQNCWTPAEGLADELSAPVWVGSLRRKSDDEAEILNAAAALFVSGVELNFTAMEGEALAYRQRIALPTYPFQRKRYWLDAQFGSSRHKLEQENLFYELRWQISDPVAVDLSRFKSRTWLVLGSNAGLSGALQRSLEASGSRALLAELPADPAAIPGCLTASLEKAMADAECPLGGVIHLWGLNSEEPQEFTGFQTAQESGVLSAHALAQRLMGFGCEAELWLVSRGAYQVVGSDGVDATHAPLWGLGKSIAMAHPEIWGGMLDLPPGAETEALAEQVLQVLAAGDGEDHAALREGRRWVTRLEPATCIEYGRSLNLDAGGSYLITGGLGAIGLQLAQRLVERGARHLVLAARRAPDEHAGEIIRRLEAKGCQIRTFQCDVGQEADVNRLFDGVEQSGTPRLAGIFHAAGISQSTNFEQLSRERFIEVMAPKVWGAWLLDRAVRVRELDLSLFVCFSSAASLWGVGNQANYAAANLYLDALMWRRRAEGLAGCSVNFGPWGETGMAADEEIARQQKALGFRTLKPKLGLDAMEAIIVSGATQMAIVDVDWGTFKPLVEWSRPLPLLEKFGPSGTADEDNTDTDGQLTLLKELDDASADQRIELLRNVVQEELARVLKKSVEDLDDDVGFFDLGMDSLMAVEFSKGLSIKVGRKLPATVVMDRTDVGTLTAYIIDEILCLSGITVKDGAQQMSETDETELEVEALSAGEVESALDDELKEILG